MQVARNFFLSSEKTLTRKLYEALLAFKIEHSLTKDQILELYVNQIYLGQRAYGFAAAAQIYFGKALKEVSRRRGRDAGRACRRRRRSINPVVNPKRATQRQQYVLRRMHELGYITDAQYADAQKAPLRTSSRDLNELLGARRVRRRDGAPGARTSAIREDVYTRGFRVYTTITQGRPGRRLRQRCAAA